MENQFRCPVCFDNRTRFIMIYHFSHEVHLDADTGHPVYEAPELETLLRADGTPDIDVRCMDCNYMAPLHSFSRQRSFARQQHPSRAANT